VEGSDALSAKNKSATHPILTTLSICKCRSNHTVNVNAELSIIIVTTTAEIFHEIRTCLHSCLSGQNRSKKKAAPKMNATAIPTKMLYDAAPMKLLL
jgi:hypothetical protein